MTYCMASNFRAFSALAFSAMYAKNSLSFMSATLIASAIPEIQSRCSKVFKKSLSFMIANGVAKVPKKFFLPKALILFFTPTAASF